MSQKRLLRSNIRRTIQSTVNQRLEAQGHENSVCFLTMPTDDISLKVYIQDPVLPGSEEEPSSPILRPAIRNVVFNKSYRDSVAVLALGL